MGRYGFIVRRWLTLQQLGVGAEENKTTAYGMMIIYTLCRLWTGFSLFSLLFPSVSHGFDCTFTMILANESSPVVSGSAANAYMKVYCRYI